MKARMLGVICSLLAAMPNLIGCESSRSQDHQFEKQVKRAQECRHLQDKLIGDQAVTPNETTMDQMGWIPWIGCGRCARVAKTVAYLTSPRSPSPLCQPSPCSSFWASYLPNWH